MSKYMSHSGSVTYGVNSDDPLSGGPLETLFMAGQLFPAWEVRINEKKPIYKGDALRIFYCPMCPSIKLRLAADPVAKCMVCGWNSKKVDKIDGISDLMARDADPWPKIASVIDNSVARWKMRQNETNADEIRRRLSSRMEVKYDTFFHNEGDDETMRGLVKPKLKDTKYEDYLERNKYIPEDIVVLAANVWKREQLPPRRRLPPPELQVISPTANLILKKAVFVNPKSQENAAAFLPRVTSAVVDHDCARITPPGQKVHVWLELINGTNTDLQLLIANETEVKMLRKSQCMVDIKAPMKRVLHGERGRCEYVVPVPFYLKVEHDGRSHDWYYTVFVWHQRAMMKPNEKWLLKTASKRIE